MFANLAASQHSRSRARAMSALSAALLRNDRKLAGAATSRPQNVTQPAVARLGTSVLTAVLMLTRRSKERAK